MLHAFNKHFYTMQRRTRRYVSTSSTKYQLHEHQLNEMLYGMRYFGFNKIKNKKFLLIFYELILH